MEPDLIMHVGQELDNMKEKIDLSLNRSLEELIASYWEAVNGEIDATQYGSFYALEDYLSNMGAI